MLEAVSPSLFGELARTGLPALVALVGVGIALWVAGRARGPGIALLLGMGTVGASLAAGVVVFPTLVALTVTGTFDPGPVGYRVVAALLNFGEGLGLALTALGGLLGAGPEEDE